jgi:hypothetical protein
MATTANGSADVAEGRSRGGDGAGVLGKAATAVAQTATEAFEAVKQTAQGAGVSSGNRPAGTGGDPRKQVRCNHPLEPVPVLGLHWYVMRTTRCWHGICRCLKVYTFVQGPQFPYSPQSQTAPGESSK